MTASSTFDYVIAGGGTAGCALASRLSQALPKCSIALVEAGPDAHDDPRVLSPLGAPKLHGTELEWNAQTVLQKSLNGRQIYQTGGKLLSGSSGVNYGTWTRGPAKDYDHWSETVGDGKWSYEQMLPCFRRSETHHGTDKNDDQHGFNGPIHTRLPDTYPLRDTLRKAFDQAGIAFIKDPNRGDPIGLAYTITNWYNYARQPAGLAYDLSKVTVFTDMAVSNILFEHDGDRPVAKGILLQNGSVLTAKREVIISCGALATPKLLMLSGIGDKTVLAGLGISTVADNPQVGQNLHDHVSSMLMWRLKHPEKGFAVGSKTFPDIRYAPNEWIYTDNVSLTKLAAALAVDDPASDPNQHRNIANPSGHFETTIVYTAVGTELMAVAKPPADGSIITVGCGLMAPTSRGTVKLTSSDPSAPPAIDPNYLSTEHDLCVLRESVRQTIRVMKMDAIKDEIAGIYPWPGMPEIDADSPDEVLNDYMKKLCICWFHPAGTAAMGTVVDSSCRVKGVERLRVVDTSIFPMPIAAHYQSPVYAVAERAAELIVNGE